MRAAALAHGQQGTKASGAGWGLHAGSAGEGPLGWARIRGGNGARVVSFHGRGEEPLAASFDRMVRADVLVLARSSLSFVAGVLNARGAICYSPFWHGPAEKSWLVLGDDGGCDEGALRKELRRCRRDVHRPSSAALPPQ